MNDWYVPIALFCGILLGIVFAYIFMILNLPKVLYWVETGTWIKGDIEDYDEDYKNVN